MRLSRLSRRVTVLVGFAFVLTGTLQSEAHADTPAASSASGDLPSAPPPSTAAPDAPVPASAPNPTPIPILAPPAAPSPPLEEVSPLTGRLYGFIESRFNATTAEPNGNVNPDGTPSRYAPLNGDLALPAFHVMAQGSLYSRFKYYFNIAAFDADTPTHDQPVGVRNAWLEVSVFGDYLNVRVGKLYRRFGLYNEIIDTVPSFIGIETPTFISGDRPMLTRTTNAMVHGKASTGEATISYAATIGKDEASIGDERWSPGFDLNLNWNSTILVGTSYYTTAGPVIPSNAPGEGPPAGGVAPWLAEDRFQVYGGYAQLELGPLLLHGEAWISPHEATRDLARVQVLQQNAANYSDVNRARLAGTDAHYTYSTVDVRAAYTLEVGSGDEPITVTPYVDYNYIQNLESISDRRYGGDGEPGQSPKGLAMHARLGAVVKPVPVVAVKVEGTHAMFDYGGGFVSDEELWLSLSYQWELFHK